MSVIVTSFKESPKNNNKKISNYYNPENCGLVPWIQETVWSFVKHFKTMFISLEVGEEHGGDIRYFNCP